MQGEARGEERRGERQREERREIKQRNREREGGREGGREREMERERKGKRERERERAREGGHLADKLGHLLLRDAALHLLDRTRHSPLRPVDRYVCEKERVRERECVSDSVRV